MLSLERVEGGVVGSREEPFQLGVILGCSAEPCQYRSRNLADILHIDSSMVDGAVKCLATCLIVNGAGVRESGHGPS